MFRQSLQLWLNMYTAAANDARIILPFRLYLLKNTDGGLEASSISDGCWQSWHPFHICAADGR
jgi:hypothetical protein